MERDFTKPSLLRREDMRLTWGEGPKTATFGYQRALYTEVVAQSCTVRLVMLPFGQGRPRHRNSAEHVHYQITSRIEFEIAGEKYVVSPGDLLFIPANVDYQLANVGDVDALFLHVLSKASEWPPKAIFPEEGTVVVQREGVWVVEDSSANA